MSILAWFAIVYGVLILPALVVFVGVLVEERNSPDQPPYVKATWESLEVPLSGWLLYPLLLPGAFLIDLWGSVRRQTRRG